ncbi:MAG: type II secretion system protein [Phycisphaerae bacterium]
MKEGYATRRSTPRGGFTLAEMLVSIGILALLVGILIVGAKAIFASQARSSARQQMVLIASAIDRYATFWPKWEAGGVAVSRRGWPDHIAGRLFDATRFSTIPQFNDDVSFDPATDAFNANMCLTYALTASAGQGPYLTLDDDRALIKDVREVFPSITNPLLPAKLGQTAARRAYALVDPWGTPYRYFWIYRDSETNAGQRAFRGVLPVDYGAFQSGTGPGGVGAPEMRQPDGSLKLAVGFVLESAGPDRQFGNVWKVSPSTAEIDAAEDNLVTKLP